MQRIVGEYVDGVKGGEDPTVEKRLRAEDDAEEGRHVGLVLIVVGVVEWGRLGEKIYVMVAGHKAAERNGATYLICTPWWISPRGGCLWYASWMDY